MQQQTLFEDGRLSRPAAAALAASAIVAPALAAALDRPSRHWSTRIWYALLQASLGFDAGYTVAFATIITLYSIATGLYWTWFRRVDRQALAARAAA